MEENQEVIKHVCKFCSKKFPCGRSLGGHMRSHDHVKINDHHYPDHDHDDDDDVDNDAATTMKKYEGCSEGYYGLRENPKKTWRVLTDSTNEQESSDVVLDKLCKECGKGFQSLKALFGHMKCHSDKERVSNYHKKKNNSFEFDEQVSKCGKNSDTDTTVLPNRKRRSKRKLRTRYMNCNTSTSIVSFNANSVSEVEKEQEEVALSLIMLSRDVGSWVGLDSIPESSDNNDNNSLELVSKIEGKRVIKCSFSNLNSKGKTSSEIFANESQGSDGLKMKKSRVSVIENEKDKKKKKIEVDSDSAFEFNVRTKSGTTNAITKYTSMKEKFFDSESKGNDGLKMKKTRDSAIENRKGKKKMKIEVDSDSAFEVNVRTKSATTNTKYTSMKAKFFDSETKVTSQGECSKKKSHKRGKFECTTCNRIFHSYQALGGHRASHKRTKGCFASKNEQSSENENSNELVEVDMKINVNGEEKMLESESVVVSEDVSEIRNFLDLNLPAASVVDERNGHVSEVYRPWWLVGSNLKQESMVGLLSN